MLVCTGTLLSFGVAFGEGDYQKTKDGRTTVWNSEPKPGDQATWFGDRDGEGYAKGAGTLTWYTESGTIYGRYFGNMVKGKFTGPVNLHLKGRTAHAVFADGQRVTRWTGGPASSRTAIEPGQQLVAKANAAKPSIAQSATQNPIAAKPQPAATEKAKSSESIAMTDATKPSESSASTSTTTATNAQPANPEPPAEGPSQVNQDVAKVEEAKPEEAKPIAAAMPKPKPSVAKSNPKVDRSTASNKAKRGMDSSLEQLVGPPTSLHTEPTTDVAPTIAPAVDKLEAPAGPNTELSAQDAINLADTEASAQGYDLNEYQRPKADYSTVRDKWSIFYDSKPTEGMTQMGKHFLVTIEDKTKKASIESLR
jgi:hypothetical protein